MASERAGQPAQSQDLVDVVALEAAYYEQHPDPGVVEQRVSFGTSGHRGSSLATTFNEDHIVATSQAICEHRAAQGIAGPLYLGIDTHALSRPAMQSATRVFAANDVIVLLDSGDRFTPTPSLSRAILAHNEGRTSGLADGVVVTPSHNPPARRRLQVQPAQRRPRPGLTSPKWRPGPRQRPDVRAASCTATSGG